jgi:hypothetical protein
MSDEKDSATKLQALETMLRQKQETVAKRTLVKPLVPIGYDEKGQEVWGLAPGQ